MFSFVSSRQARVAAHGVAQTCESNTRSDRGLNVNHNHNRSSNRGSSAYSIVASLALAASFGAANELAAQVRRPTRSTADSATADSARRIERVLVNAIRSSDAAPVTQKTIERDVIDRRNFGQDVPLLLQSASPSLTAHTETGTNWGYSYLRLRGLDQTRINITIDGVPLNDMEDQVLYFANFADLLSNVQSVQVQRGVGTSSAGTASFAGSINFETNPIAGSTPAGDAAVQLGSFGAQRVTVGGRSGRIGENFAVYARGSALRTNGYRDHSGVLGRTGFLGAGWFGQRDIVKLTALAGLLSDTLSYVGATLAELGENRRYNPLQAGELDRFGQQMVALAYTRILDAGNTLNTTVYRNSASGNYDYFDGDDRYRYNLAHSWYGVTSAFNGNYGALRTNLGVNANIYQRAHRAYLRPDVTLYDNVGHKNDASAFGKVSYDYRRATWFGDLQVRTAEFRYEPDANAAIAERSKRWTFVNPKVGVSFQLQEGLSAYASYGQTTREPTRSDLLAGEDDLNQDNVDAYGDFSRVKPESVRDAELGIRLRRGRVELQGNLYNMDFHNDIARIGPPTASGSVLRRNVGRSFRRGFEMDATVNAPYGIQFGGNVTLSDNRIRQFTDSSRGAPVMRENVQPLLTPRVVTSQRVSFPVTNNLTLSADGRYQSRAFLDNTGSEDRVLPAYYVVDGSARFTLAQGRYSLVARGVNLGNSQLYGSGSVSSSGKVRYFILPARSLYVTAEIVF